jgi:hypothetical protein
VLLVLVRLLAVGGLVLLGLSHRCVIPNAPQLAALAQPAEVNERIIRFLRGTACTTRSEAA